MTVASEAMGRLAPALEFLAAAAGLRRVGAVGAACADDLDRLLRIENRSQHLAVAVSATDAAKALERAGRIVTAAEQLLPGRGPIAAPGMVHGPTGERACSTAGGASRTTSRDGRTAASRTCPTSRGSRAEAAAPPPTTPPSTRARWSRRRRQPPCRSALHEVPTVRVDSTMLTTLITPEVSSALLEAGITAAPVNPSQVALRRAHDGAAPLLATVRRRTAPLSPSHVRRPAQAEHRGGLLLVVPAASAAALGAARDAGVSVVVVGDGRPESVSGHVVMDAEVVDVGPAGGGAAPATPPRRPGPPPWGTSTVVRHLLTGAVAGQAELAGRAGISQGRVSQVLSPLVSAGLVRRTTAGGRARWAAADWDALADRWTQTYQGPGGFTTCWYGLAPVREQAVTVAAALGAAGLPVAVSGDVAADVLAPWHRPARAVLYADVEKDPAAADLARAGLVPSGAQEATVELVVPADPGVWAPPDHGTSGGLPLADGMQVLWDLGRAPGSDVDQAVDVLRGALRARARSAAERR